MSQEQHGSPGQDRVAGGQSDFDLERGRTEMDDGAPALLHRRAVGLLDIAATCLWMVARPLADSLPGKCYQCGIGCWH